MWYLNAIRALPQPVYREIEDQNWMTAWKEHYQPIEIGKKLLILPAWIEQKDMSRVAVKIDPSMAFGTGTHPSTQLCLELVEDYVQSRQIGDRYWLRLGHPLDCGIETGRKPRAGGGY